MLRYSWIGLAVLAWPTLAVAAAGIPLSAPVVLTAAAAQPLTLSDAIARALQDNPALKAAAFTLRVQDARRDQAGLKPAWHGTLDAENFLGSGRLRGVDALETTLRLGTIIERGGKRDRRIGQVDAETTLLAIDQDVARLDLLAEVARRYIHVVADQEVFALTQQASALATRGTQLVEQRVRAAKAGDAESGKARIALARAEIAHEHAEHELKSARVALAATWNAREPGFERAEAAFFALPEPESLDSLVTALERNPNLARFASARRVEDARLALARSNRMADVTFNAGIRRLEAGNDQGFVLSLSVPFGSAARAAPFEHEAEFRRDAIDAEVDAVRADLYRTLYALYQELLHARTQADALRTRVIPEAERTLQHAEAGYALGRYSYLELVDAQQQLLTVRREAIDAARDYHLFFVELERLAGRSLGAAAAETAR
ncbi:TolC family protein [Tahibacter sp.]|uniref:TolC family protein n=1 Tax=Tahibacter sp. TaxID=2056211 RepID=UPI0028C3AEBC|nr:TolC family protein [Tahibacter sp.]